MDPVGPQDLDVEGAAISEEHLGFPSRRAPFRHHHPQGGSLLDQEQALHHPHHPTGPMEDPLEDPGEEPVEEATLEPIGSMP